jgi:hypothetical protein
VRFKASAAKQMRTAPFWGTTQRVVLISCRRFGCPDASARNYHYSLRSNPEQHSSKENGFIFRCRQVPFLTGISGVDHRHCKIFPLKKRQVSVLSRLRLRQVALRIFATLSNSCKEHDYRHLNLIEISNIQSMIKTVSKIQRIGTEVK